MTRVELFCQESSVSRPANQRGMGAMCSQAHVLERTCDTGDDTHGDFQWSEKSDLRGRSHGKTCFISTQIDVDRSRCLFSLIPNSVPPFGSIGNGLGQVVPLLIRMSCVGLGWP